MGTGGTGKSVISAELLRRGLACKENVGCNIIAWHFCRHDDAAKSEPKTVLSSLAAMMCHQLPSYKAKLEENIDTIQEAFGKNLEDVFHALFNPLSEIEAPSGSDKTPCVVLIDALDELPNDKKRHMLTLFTSYFTQLPSWIRLFVTSREENIIKRAFENKFEPFELCVDEEKNIQDLRSYLREIAKPVFD